MYAPRTRTAGTTTGWWAVLGVLVLALDGFLLVAHALHHLGEALDPEAQWMPWFRAGSLWSAGQEGSLGELFGHLQLGLAAVLLLVLAARSQGHRVLAAWGVAFLAMVADDFLELHERVGRSLGLDRVLPGLTAMGAQELGGLLFWGLFGSLLGLGLVLSHRRSLRAARSVSWTLLAVLVPLGLVAAGYVCLSVLRPDLLDGVLGATLALVRITTKLLTMTVLLVYTAYLAEESAEPDPVDGPTG
ncbi:hypothetical protein [Kocuria oceani]|uniref:DUF998 domain-containing protein n=1 Tax=Kocuria oceani TaxID=988827 RepID=A0ABV9TE99_9MICC|nr:hypothetical protein [Kocuria oceani]